MQLLEKEIEQLLQKAEAADSTPLQDGLSVPQEVARRKERIEKLREATAAIEARACWPRRAAQGRQRHGRSVEALEKRDDPPAPEPGAGPAALMAHRLSTKAGRARNGLRKQAIEPVFGIIKAAMGFRR